MLGNRVSDPFGVDGDPGEAAGLGLLDVDTIMTRHKEVKPVSRAVTALGPTTSGYVIHAGRTSGPDANRPFINFGAEQDGARSANGRIEGTYLHGAFAGNEFRRAWLEQAGHFRGQISTMVRRWTPLWTNWPMASSKPWMLMRC